MVEESVCPGCQLRLPIRDDPPYRGYFHTTTECWALFTEVIGTEFGNAVVFGQVHQLTVDAYAVQHAGGDHPDKSVCVHLAGLHLALVRGWPSPRIAPLLQRFATSAEEWPHFEPPIARVPIGIRDVANAAGAREHIERVREWAGMVWAAWSEYHAEVSRLVERHLNLDR